MPTSCSGRARRGRPALPAVLVLGVAAGALGMTGCTLVPTSGPVVQGRTVVIPGADSVVRVIARPPAAGAEPAEIVRGFLAASASPEDDFAVARSYLTREAAERWRPGTGTRVYDASAALTAQAAEVRLSAPLLAVIDGSGHLTVTPPEASLTVTFGLTRVARQWRIDQPPAGLLLTRGDLARGYRTYPAWYLGVAREVLVPAGITLPVTAAGTPTALTRALLAGPPPWLAPAVRSALPAGTRLTVDAVPVIDGVAAVELDAGVLIADPADRRRLAAQVVTTLTGLPGVTGVRIAVSGVPVTVPGASQPFTVADFADLQVQPVEPLTLVASLAGRIVTSPGDPALPPVPVTSSSLTDQVALTSPAVDFTRGRWAAKVAGQAAVVVGELPNGSRRIPRTDATGALRIPVPGGGVRGPTLGPDGRVWLAGGGSVFTVDERGLAQVDTSPVGTDVLAVAPSPDGARVALIVRTPAGDVLRLAALSTTAAPEVQSVLTGVQAVERDLTRVDSVAWRDPLTLVAVNGQTGPTEIPAIVVVNVLDGSERPLPTLIGARNITATVGASIIAASGDDTQPILHRLTESGWQVIGQGGTPAWAPGTPTASGS